MRCLGMPVVPPVSKMLKGRPLNFAGTQTSGWQVAQPFILEMRERWR